MTKQERISWWKLTASKDWDAVDSLLKGKNYVQALFWAHLVLEKLLKAHWIKDNKEDNPPKTHNLIKLTEHISLTFSESEKRFLEKMNDFQIEGHYPEYINNIYKIYKEKQTTIILEQVQELITCLLENLP